MTAQRYTAEQMREMAEQLAQEGWKIVPVVPTIEMKAAGFESRAWDKLGDAVLKIGGWPYSCKQSSECVAGIYADMIQAAPRYQP